MTRMSVVLQEDLLQQIRDLVPARQRSEFIEEAVRARLAQLRQIRGAEAAAGAWSDEGRGNPEEEIRQSRRGWEDRRSRLRLDHGQG